MKTIPPATAHTSTLTVTEAHTARTLGSGDLPVLGTPALAALAPLLEPGESSVGVALNMTHDRASAIGDRIRATATVVAVEGRRIDFRLEATDPSGQTILGRGSHSRFVIDVEKFMRKIEK